MLSGDNNWVYNITELNNELDSTGLALVNSTNGEEKKPTLIESKKPGNVITVTEVLTALEIIQRRFSTNLSPLREFVINISEYIIRSLIEDGLVIDQQGNSVPNNFENENINLKAFLDNLRDSELRTKIRLALNNQAIVYIVADPKKVKSDAKYLVIPEVKNLSKSAIGVVRQSALCVNLDNLENSTVHKFLGFSLKQYLKYEEEIASQNLPISLAAITLAKAIWQSAIRSLN